ncbi:MAG: MFS transporter [Flavobacteriales bacterium]|nr:MFS transporter [Flavobacteriales bacterium]
MENKRALTLLFTSHVVSSFAQGITMLSIPWYFASIVNQSVVFGKVLAVATFISIFWSLFAGTLIDRYPRKNIFWIASVVGFLVLGGAGLYGEINQEAPIWLVAAIFVFTFFGFNIHYPNLYAFSQQLAARGDYGRVNSMIEVLGQSTNVLSGALGAILLSGTTGGAIDLLGFQVSFPFEIEQWRIWEVFLLDAFTYAAAACIIPFIKYVDANPLPIDLDRIAERFKRGWRFLMLNKELLVFGLASYSIFVVLLVEVQFLLPIFVDNQLEAGADVYASSEVYFALGSLFAGFLIMKLTRNLAPSKTIVLLMLAAGTSFVVVAFSKSIIGFYLFSVLIGFANAGTRITRVTFLFNHVPNNIIGRANSIFYVYNITSRGLLLTIFSMPFFSASNNIVYSYIICGGFILVSVIPLFVALPRLQALKVRTE